MPHTGKLHKHVHTESIDIIRQSKNRTSDIQNTTIELKSRNYSYYDIWEKNQETRDTIYY